MPRNTRNQKQNDEDTANSDSVNVRNDHLVKLINTVDKLCDRIKSLEEEIYSLKKEKSEILRILQ
jgi:predicted RNase H-like nuclease (RuvC/YqgF family)